VDSLDRTCQACFSRGVGSGSSARQMSFVARHGRIDLRVPVIVGIGGDQVTAEPRNVGLGGVFVATRELSSVGQRVSLRLALPDWDESLVLRGEVRWVRGADDSRHPDDVTGMGIKFVKMSLYVAASLDNVVRSHTLAR
jgi:uncharacterized protein (TIGR02266 family)